MLGPNGQRNQRYHPYGVANVVSMLDSGSISICQNVDAKSILVTDTRASVRAGDKSSVYNWNLAMTPLQSDIESFGIYAN